jgi:fibronectin-binding autotransporter adhesin
MFRFRNAITSFGLTLCLAFSASAQTWNGGGANDNWSTGGAGGNWSGAAAPLSGTTTSLTFAGTTRLTPFNDITDPFTFNTLTFASDAGAFNLGGSPLLVDGATRSITSNTTANVAFTQNVTFGDTGTINTTNTGGISFGGTFTVAQGTVSVLSNNVSLNNLRLNSDGTQAIFDTGANTVALNGNVFFDAGGFTGEPAEIRGILNLNGGVRDFTATISVAVAYDLIISAQLTGGAGSGISFSEEVGNVLLTGQNTYAGTTFINNPNGGVYLGASNTISPISPVAIGNGGFLSLRTPVAQGSIVAADYDHQFASLSSSFANAEIRFGDTTTLTVGDATNRVFAGFLTQGSSAGTPTLIKTGTGRWTLSGNSTQDPSGTPAPFSGSVIVNQGTLAVTTPVNGTNSGTGRGTVLVNSGGILAGNGAIVPNRGSQAANTITIASGGTISPDGLSGPIGNLRLGAVGTPATVMINGTYAVDLTTITSDTLTINGSLTLGGTSVFNASGITSTPGSTTFLSFVIASFDNGGLTGTFASTSIPDGSIIEYNSNNITLLVPVPEPGTVLGLTAGLLMCGAWIRRRMTRA